MAHDTIGKFLARLPQDMAASFGPGQLAAIQLHFGMRYSVTHKVDIRKRISLGQKKFYFVILAGNEKRPVEN